MYGEGSITTLCDTHPDDVAQALCKYHKKLLCLSCVLDKAKSTECSITELRKISSEQDTALYDCLILRQIAMKKKRLIEEHENKTNTLKNKMNQQVTELHQKLVTRLTEMKEYCIKSIDNQASAVMVENNYSKQQLDTVEIAITDSLEKLSGESIDDLSAIRTNLNETKVKLLKEIADKNEIPEGQFLPSKHLEDLILQSGCPLGKALLVSSEHYIDIDAIKRENIEDNPKEKIQQQADGTQTSDRSKEAKYMASDEVVCVADKTNQPPASNTGNQAPTPISTAEKYIKTEDSSKKQEDREKTKSNEDENKTGSKTQEQKAEKRGIITFLFGKKKSHSSVELSAVADTEIRRIPAKKQTASEPCNVTEKTYQDIAFATSGLTQPRYLINKTVTIAGIQQYLKAACKFKLVYLGAGYIGLLSKAHESVVVTNLDGKLCAMKTIPGLTNIAAVGKDEIALIVENKLQVSKYKITNKGFSTLAGFVVNAEILKITGFDFDDTLSQYAISLPGKLVILNKNGKTLKVKAYAPRNVSDEVVTTYDFINDCLYTLDILNKTLKCFSFANDDSLWKCKCEGQMYTPRNMCLYKNKLCVSWGDAIALFCAENGNPIVKHDTKDVLDDCFGMCVIDDVIVFSSNSDAFDTSTKIAFISV